MAVTDRYSRLVFWLKVTLPLAALGILSTLFFMAETLDPEAAIPYAQVDVARVLAEQGVTRPSFGMVTEDGVAITLMADVIRSGNGADTLGAEDLHATLDLPNGAQIVIDAPMGTVLSGGQEVVLEGGTRLQSSTGYVIETARIVTSVTEGALVADQPITATGPLGRIDAGAMELKRSESADGHLLVFKNRVRLLYQP